MAALERFSSRKAEDAHGIESLTRTTSRSHMEQHFKLALSQTNHFLQVRAGSGIAHDTPVFHADALRSHLAEHQQALERVAASATVGVRIPEGTPPVSTKAGSTPAAAADILRAESKRSAEYDSLETDPLVVAPTVPVRILLACPLSTTPPRPSSFTPVCEAIAHRHRGHGPYCACSPTRHVCARNSGLC
jgi:hypothetical protein